MTDHDLTLKVGEKLLVNNLNSMEENKGPWWTSSVDPLKLSLTIRGALVLYIPFLLELASTFNLPLTDTKIADWITMVSFAIGGLMLVVGLVRKAWVWYKESRR